jgi:hypothetical protein
MAVKRTIPSDMAQAMKSILDNHKNNIKTHGFSTQYVLADENSPGFGYTIGLSGNPKHPEIVLVGFDPGLTNTLLNDAAARVIAGDAFANLQRDSRIIKNYDVEFRVVQVIYSRKAPLNLACRLMNVDEVPCMQLFLPDAAGKFPWDAGCDPTYKNRQSELFGWDFGQNGPRPVLH